jgi:hypothetical protein
MFSGGEEKETTSHCLPFSRLQVAWHRDLEQSGFPQVQLLFKQGFLLFDIFSPIIGSKVISASAFPSLLRRAKVLAS